MGADPVRYRWRIPYPVLLSGVRPNEMDWYRIDRPEWYVGEGWALTPEAAGVSAVDRRGLSTGPIEGWISRNTLSGTLVVGGRNFDPAAQPQVEVLVNGQLFDQVKIATNGGPNEATLTVTYLLWRQGFRDLNMGYASALGVILFVVIFAVSLVQRRFLDVRPDY